MVSPLKTQNKQGTNSSLASYVSTYIKESSHSLGSIKHMETNKPLTTKIN